MKVTKSSEVKTKMMMSGSGLSAVHFDSDLSNTKANPNPIKI